MHPRVSGGHRPAALNLSLAKTAEESFHFRAGMDPAAEPIIGAYSQQDHEEFIR